MQGILLANGLTIPGKVGLVGGSLMLEIPTENLTSSVKNALRNASNTSTITYYYGLYKNVYRGYTEYAYNEEDDDPFDGVSYVWLTNTEQAAAESARAEARERGETVEGKISSNNSTRVYLGPLGNGGGGGSGSSGRLQPRDYIDSDKTLG